jgi:starch synthase
MRVVHVSSEVAPFAQSGGLADVLAGLPAAQAEHENMRVAVVVPLYRGVTERLAAAGLTLEPGTPIVVVIGPHRFEAALRRVAVGRVTYAFVDCAPLYDRGGTLYGPGGPSEFADNHVRFAVLGKAALEHGASLVGGPIEVLHVHDWQGAPAAVYARLSDPAISIVTTIHNLAYRGIFPKQVMDELGFPWTIFTVKSIEFWDQVCFLKGGMAMADVVTTVSPTYAKEIVTPERGEALDGFLKWDIRRLVGIVNGIDTQAWDPMTDPALPAPFSAEALAGKAACRAAVAKEMKLPIADDTPLIGVIARMTDQKGLDLVADIAPQLGEIGARLIVLGSGEPTLEGRFQALSRIFPEHIAVRIGFDVGLSRRIYAGSDLFLMPSRFEPCGLGQLYAMRYGALPVVTSVGGLRDTVTDPGDAGLVRGEGTGIRFEPPTAASLAGALRRGVKLFRDPKALAAARRAAMARDSSWTASARQYTQVYRSLR